MRTNVNFCWLLWNQHYWTPYSDEAEEGVYISLEDGSKPSFLPWAPGQPNGAETENGIDIRLDFRNSTLPLYYYDQGSHKGQEKRICSSCSLAEYFSLTLKGVCKHTLMGEQNNFTFSSFSFDPPQTQFMWFRMLTSMSSFLAGRHQVSGNW